MTRILIADDHAIVRAGLKQIIAEAEDLTVAGEATNGQDVLDLIEKEPFDVIVLDLSMPGRGGMDTLKQLKALHASVPVLVLSMHSEQGYAMRALKSGAAGYLTKESAPDELVNALRRVASGRKYITESLAEEMARSLERPQDDDVPHKNLSDREFQVMCLIASGLTVSEIAIQLTLSVKTVSTYRERILEKMQMKTNSELTHYVLTNHLLE
jgi:two-component system, NarL family, invasion response regulator UvrY